MKTVRLLSFFAASAALSVVILTASGCGKESPTASTASPSGSGSAPASSSVSVGQPGEEVAAVKQMLQKFAKIKSPAEFADYLSNESAALFGIVMLLPLSFAAAMESQGGKTDSQTKTEIETVLKRYGLNDMSSAPTPEQEKRLIGQGRQLMADVGALLERMSKSRKSEGFKIDETKLPKELENLTFEVVSPTEVKITPKDPKERAMKAIVEEGKWRLHIGGMDELKKMGNAPSSPSGQ
jgi:hypothetical protein